MLQTALAIIMHGVCGNGSGDTEANRPPQMIDPAFDSLIHCNGTIEAVHP